MPVKDVLSANVEEGRVSDGRASKEKSGAAEALGDSEYFPCNGIDVVGRIDGPLKLSLNVDKREQFENPGGNPREFSENAISRRLLEKGACQRFTNSIGSFWTTT